MRPAEDLIIVSDRRATSWSAIERHHLDVPMVTFSIQNLCGLPVAWEQRGKVVLVGHRRQLGEDVAQVEERILAEAATGPDDRVQHGGTLAGLRVAHEQPVFLAEGGRTDRILYAEIAIMPS